jgi:hypothetical protein
MSLLPGYRSGAGSYGEGFVPDTSSANRDGDKVQVTQAVRWISSAPSDSLRFVFRLGYAGEGYMLGQYDFTGLFDAPLAFKVYLAK